MEVNVCLFKELSHTGCDDLNSEHVKSLTIKNTDMKRLKIDLMLDFEHDTY